MLRYRTPDSELRVKMWLFPALSVLTALGIVAILVQMFIDTALRSQLVLSLLSWAVVIVLYVINKWFVKRRPQNPKARAEADSQAATAERHVPS